MSDRPLLFISAVSSEHRSLRGTIAGILDHEGYDTVFQEVLGTEHGDITGMLMRRVDACDGVIQVIGQRYGMAPPAPHPQFGECSYTQFEALYARSIGKPVRYLLLDPAHPSDADPAQPEPPEQQALQAAYRQRIEADSALFHLSGTLAETENSIYRLRPVLEELRREWRARMDRQERELRRLRPLPILAGITLAALVVLGGWFLLREREHTGKQEALAKAQEDTLAKVDSINRRLDTKLDLMERELAAYALELRERGRALADYTPDQVLAELAARQKTTPQELKLLLDAALSSDDRSVRAQALMIKQQFPEAAKLSREAGDAKVERLKAMQARTAALAEEAARDYHREGHAHYYQLHYPTAITSYETALGLITRSSHPETWASLQNDLAAALWQHGSRTDPATGNQLLARAVSACRSALEVRTREALPQDWAQTQTNLGSALLYQGLRSEGQAGLDLLGQAVSAFRAALEVRTREALPQQWAMTQTNLGNALLSQGRRREGQAGLDLLDQAVSAHRAALEVYTREALPQQWAAAQNNLGYVLKAQGDKVLAVAERQRLYREAEAAYLAALEVWTKETAPHYHGMGQKNLDLLREKMAVTK